MKDDRLLRAAMRRRAQEEIIERGNEIKRGAKACAVCGCTLRINMAGYSWCTQTRKHGVLS